MSNKQYIQFNDRLQGGCYYILRKNSKKDGISCSEHSIVTEKVSSAGEDAREPAGLAGFPRSQDFWRLPQFLLRTYVRDPERFSAASWIISGSCFLLRTGCPRTRGSEVLRCERGFLEASAASVHQLITSRTLRTLREVFFCGRYAREPG